MMKELELISARGLIWVLDCEQFIWLQTAVLFRSI